MVLVILSNSISIENAIILDKIIGTDSSKFKKKILSLKEEGNVIKFREYSLILRKIKKIGVSNVYYISVIDKTDKVILQDIGPIFLKRDKND